MSASTKFSLRQYHDMIRAGYFEPREEHRVELLYGEIISMSPIGTPHIALVMALTKWSFASLPPDSAEVMIQGSIAIEALESEPEPDVVWLRPRDYTKNHPAAVDVLLLIEVSDSSLSKDQGAKARLYAEAGIPDFWIVNLPDRRVEVHRDPSASGYRTVALFQAGEEVHPLAFPEASLPVARLFPG